MYTVKSVFSTVQGEGHHAGRAAVFVRLAGCNMWSGIDAKRAEDAVRNRAHCPIWCDTDFRGGEHMNLDDLVARVRGHHRPGMMVVVTGGEPLLQVDHALARRLSDEFVVVAVETNGTLEPTFDEGDVWVTMSPKRARSETKLKRADEVKLVYPSYDPAEWDDFPAKHRWLQPLDRAPMLPLKVHRDRDEAEDEARAQRLIYLDAVEYAKNHAAWRVSVQSHKLLGVP